MPHRVIHLWYLLVAVVVTVLIMALSSAWYTQAQSIRDRRYADQAAQRSVHQMCDLFVALDNNNTATPPTDANAKARAVIMHRLRVQLKCDGAPSPR